jgi:hypothetical protein
MPRSILRLEHKSCGSWYDDHNKHTAENSWRNPHYYVTCHLANEICLVSFLDSGMNLVKVGMMITTSKQLKISWRNWSSSSTTHIFYKQRILTQLLYFLVTPIVSALTKKSDAPNRALARRVYHREWNALRRFYFEACDRGFGQACVMRFENWLTSIARTCHSSSFSRTWNSKLTLHRTGKPRTLLENLILVLTVSQYCVS